MPTIADLTLLQQQKVAERHARAGAAPVREMDERAVEIRDIQRQIVALVTEGAEPCKKCHTPPHGMQRLREMPMGEGKKMTVALYEIGCLACAGPESRVRGQSREEALAAWNALE
jgi:hypothetical protein